MRKNVLLYILILIATFLFTLPFIHNIQYKQTTPSNRIYKERYDAPYLYAEFHNMIRTKDGESKPSYPPSYRITELIKAKAIAQKYYKNHPQEKLNWIERGPSNVGGRTRAILVMPDDPNINTWICGSVGGGIWKTTDAGETWRNLTPDLANLATTTLAFSSSYPDIIYAGTGEGFMNLDAINGDGVFKTTDGGETWVHLKSTAKFKSINRIIVDPNNPDILLICSNDMDVSQGNATRYFTSKNSTIQRSTNGGLSWIEVYNAGSNRIQQLAFHPDNFNVQFATINGVGLIKSTDAGLTWFEINNGFKGGKRIEMAIAPSDPNRIYLSVENGNKSNLYYSSNAGEEWLNSKDTKRNINWLSSQGWYDNCIAVDPYDEDIVYVGGINIFKATFSGAKDSTYLIKNIEKSNTDEFLTFRDLKLNYENGGIGLTEELFGKNQLTYNNFVTTEIRFGNNRKQKAYRFIVLNNDTIYKDYMDIPFEVYDMDNLKQLSVGFIDVNNNSKFDLNEIESDLIIIYKINYDIKANENVKNEMKYNSMYIIAPDLKDGADWNNGNVPSSRLKINWGKEYTMLRTLTAITDGYGQYGNKNNNNIVHVDQHNITIVPLDDEKKTYRMIIGNDGGVAYSDNKGIDWTETDHNGYNTAQFYGCDKNHGSNRYIGGTQDNGTWITPLGSEGSSSTTYAHVIGGDGFEAVWHYLDSNKILGSSQFNSIRKSTNGGQTWFPATKGITDGYGSGGPFVTKIAKSNIDPDLVFAVGKSGVWRSENFGDDWNLIPIPDSLWRSGGYYSNAQVEISLANPQIVWAGILMSNNGKVQLSTDGGLTFNSVNNYDKVKLGRITGIDTDPIDENTAYVLFSFAKSPKILKTTDLGNTWEDISGFETDTVSKSGFPDVAVYSLLVMPFDRNIIWAGTEIGIVESVDGGKSWHLADNGMPNVAIWQMRIVDDQVVVATHGRGIWSVTLPELKDYEPPKVVLAPLMSKLGQAPNSNLVMKANLRYDYDSVIVNIFEEDELIETYYVSNYEIGDNLFSFDFDVTKTEDYSVQIISYFDGREYKSANKTITLYPLNEPQITYENYFESLTNDFAGKGITVDTIPNLNLIALQTPHPYPNRSNLHSYLLTPIIVADTNPIFKYEDIAIVEIGDSGTVYGHPYFYDYVVVEYTKDGFDWIPIADGYDSRYNNNWLTIYKNKGDITEDLFITHNIDLHNTAKNRDTILIRFRLYSDTYTNGWGWAIRNIQIQPEGVISGLKNDNGYYSVSLYPNPSFDICNLKIRINKPSNITVKVIDEQGKLIDEIVKGRLTNSIYNFKIFLNNYHSGLYFVVINSNNVKKIIKLINL